MKFEELWDFDAAVRHGTQFPCHSPTGLGILGLHLYDLFGDDFDPDDDHRYEECTPLNCLPFATTCGDGVHFSFLNFDRNDSSVSPVVMTIPSGRSWIVGTNLHDFLCLGYHCGYFVMYDLEYHLDTALPAFINPESPAANRKLLLSESRLILMHLLRSTFLLKPWTDSGHFQQLQSEFYPQLDLPEEMRE